jgi:hypothetical protein
MTGCLHVSSLMEHERDAAGRGWETVCAAERSAREARARLEGMEPWTRGTRGRAQRVLAGLAELLDGGGCRLARAVHNQARPWYLDDDPLRGTLRRLAVQSTQAAELAAIVENARHIVASMDRVQAEFMADVPTAFARHITSRGLTAEAVDEMLTLDEITIAGEKLKTGGEKLAAWRSDLQAWLKAEDYESELQTSPELAQVPAARLEERYELLLRLGSIQREPLLRETSQALRRSAVAHLAAIAGTASARVDETTYRLAVDAFGALVTPGISSVEMATWRECLAAYHRRATAGGAE